MIFSQSKDRKYSSSSYDGIDFCWLWKNSFGGGTALLRLLDGSTLPFHKHPGWEQIFILKGKVSFCDTILVSGDHVLIPENTTHTLIALEPSKLLVCSEKEGVEVIG